MRFSTILAIPFLFNSALAAPSSHEVILPRDEFSVGQTGVTNAAEKLCILGKCIGVDNGGPKCNIDRRHSLIYTFTPLYTVHPFTQITQNTVQSPTNYG